MGLNAIAQWTATFQSFISGLGTGQLYKNNIISAFSSERIYNDSDEPFVELGFITVNMGIVLNDRCYSDVDEISVIEDNIDVVSFLTEGSMTVNMLSDIRPDRPERLRKFIY